jgi:hypothetical protein
VHRDKLSFVTRTDYIGIEATVGNRKIECDGGELLLRYFGLKTGEIVKFGSGNPAIVQGVAGSTLCLRAVLGQADWLCEDQSLNELYGQLCFIQSGRQFGPEKIGELPFEEVFTFWVRGSAPVEVVGQVADFYVGRALFGGLRLFRKADCVRLEGNRSVYEGDRAIFQDALGSVLSVIGERVLFLADEARAFGRPPSVVDAGRLTVIATIAGSGEVPGTSYSMRVTAAPDARLLPGDIVYNKKGLAYLAGFADEIPFVSDRGEVAPLLEGEYKLLCRYNGIGNPMARIRTEKTAITVRLVADDLAGSGVCHGDAVRFGETLGIVAGVANSYVWILTYDDDVICVREPEELTVIEHPSSNLGYLFRSTVSE